MDYSSPLMVPKDDFSPVLRGALARPQLGPIRPLFGAVSKIFGRYWKKQRNRSYRANELIPKLCPGEGAGKRSQMYRAKSCVRRGTTAPAKGERSWLR